MVSELFKEVKTGQLRRMAFFGYGALLMLIPLVLMLIVVSIIGAGEQLAGGDLAQAQDKLGAWFGGPVAIIVISLMIVVFFAQLNIMAKRLRHMGLPGWWWVLGIIVINLVVTAIAGEQVGNLIGLIVALSLLFIPGGSFGQSRLDRE